MNNIQDRRPKTVQLLGAMLVIVIAAISGYLVFRSAPKPQPGAPAPQATDNPGAPAAPPPALPAGNPVAAEAVLAANPVPPQPAPIVGDPTRVPPSVLHQPDDHGDAKANQNCHVTAMILDAQKRLWVATSGEGIWCQDPSATNPWRGFGIESGLPDDFGYALACDKLGRIWVGHLNHGVSVFNGQTWKNYDVLHGPIGERVFALATSPLNGDVWIGTSAGLTRYALADDRWSHFTRASGLPADEISALAFDSTGTLFAGTPNSGLAIAHAADQYAKWTTVTSPDIEPVTATGGGLPSPQINQLFVSREGTVYAATSSGLGLSTDHGNTWSFVRGKDFADKVKRRDGGPPAGWKAPTTQETSNLFGDDFLTALAQDDSGHLWVGTREHGYDIYDPIAHTNDFGVAPEPGRGTAFVRSILYEGGRACVGLAGGGMVEITSPDAGPPAAPAPVAAAAFPKPAAAPSAAELSAMAGILQLPATPAELATHAVLLSSDWTTQGTWVGRYGRFQSTEPELPGNIKWGSGVLRMPFRCSQGMTNMLTYWTSSNYLQDPRAMEMNSVYFDTRIAQALTTPEVNRRQTEWNDGGNNVPRGGNGPGLYADIQVPEGAYEVGFYHDNDNGYQTRNRYRDFTVSVRENPSGTSVQNHNEFAQWPEITRSRIHEFWGGVYTRLLVKGPAAFTVQIGRNHSFNTTLNGLFVDPIDEYPEPYFGDLPGATVANTPPARPNASEADRLLALLETMHSQNLQRYGIMYRSMFTALARWYQDALAQSPAAADATGLQRQLATCCYRLGLFDQWESLQHDMKLHTCRDIEKSLRWDHVADDADLSSLNRPMVIAYRKGAPAGSH